MANRYFMEKLSGPGIFYQENRPINVTTQTAPDGSGWRVVVDFPPNAQSQDKIRMMDWLREYEQAIRGQTPDAHISFYCDEDQCLLEAISQVTNKQHSIVDLAKTRMRHMIDILGKYGGDTRVAYWR